MEPLNQTTDKAALLKQLADFASENHNLLAAAHAGAKLEELERDPSDEPDLELFDFYDAME